MNRKHYFNSPNHWNVFIRIKKHRHLTWKGASESYLIKVTYSSHSSCLIFSNIFVTTLLQRYNFLHPHIFNSCTTFLCSNYPVCLSVCLNFNNAGSAFHEIHYDHEQMNGRLNFRVLHFCLKKFQEVFRCALMKHLIIRLFLHFL